jgi:hypothetical protein
VALPAQSLHGAREGRRIAQEAVPVNVVVSVQQAHCQGPFDKSRCASFPYLPNSLRSVTCSFFVKETMGILEMGILISEGKKGQLKQ